VTSRHEVVKQKLQAVTTTYIIWRSIMWVLSYFWSSSVVSHVFSALCMYSKFEHHPHPLGYICAKFRFCDDLRCWTSARRKTAHSINHLINHSLSQSSSLFDAPGTEAFTSE